MTAAEYRALAEKALTPRDGFHNPHDDQVRHARALALLADSASRDALTQAIQALTDALTGNQAGITIQPAIHHSA